MKDSVYKHSSWMFNYDVFKRKQLESTFSGTDLNEYDDEQMINAEMQQLEQQIMDMKLNVNKLKTIESVKFGTDETCKAFDLGLIQQQVFK